MTGAVGGVSAPDRRQGRCPPEDVGGPWGSAEYMAAMSAHDHARDAYWLT